jgi:hypothetical protein
MRTILVQLVIQLAVLLANTDSAHSLTQDWRTGEARCHHSPEEVSLLKSNRMVLLLGRGASLRNWPRRGNLPLPRPKCLFQFPFVLLMLVAIRV